MPQCDNCEAHITRRFQRVFGNEDGEVFGCPRCTTGSDLFEGKATEARQ
ncbi:hypothetical protein V5735_01605 (plasmid) [Haladaptatus sp. SPP-AMP-3]